MEAESIAPSVSPTMTAGANKSTLDNSLPPLLKLWSAILNLIKFNFFMVYPYLKLHILFNGNGLAIWSSFPDIT